MQKCILSLDQGTSSSRAIAYNNNAKAICIENMEFEQLFPKNAWVEHDPEAIWDSQLDVAQKVIKGLDGGVEAVQAIGITNQRETTIVWNRKTGKAVYNAIVWQDRRTADFCEELKRNKKQDLVYSKTGLMIDAYFSASKLSWILDNVEGARELAENGELAFGTVDSWLVWKLTAGKLHISDASNASRTMLYNIHTLQWDEELLDLFDIPKSILPDVVESSGILGYADASIFGKEIIIGGIAGDQQAALFGQQCFTKGMAKCTYGTGSFLMLNTGKSAFNSEHRLLTTIGWKIDGQVFYALEGSVFIGGAVIQWLRDELEFFKEATDSESLAAAASDNGGVYFVPALSGLGAPYWDPYARGSIFGITRATSKAHLTRAALESICFQVNDLLKVFDIDYPEGIKVLKADGGAAENSLMIQFQSDISEIEIDRAKQLETTALGAAYLAGLGVSFWNKEDLKKLDSQCDIFKPEMQSEYRLELLSKWKKAIARSQGWENEV